MKVLVIGAGESAGEQVIKQLERTSHHTMAIVNHENRMQDVKKLGAEEAVLAVNGELTDVFPDSDAIVYVAGASPRTGEGKTTLVDHTAIIKAVKEAKRKNINRFVLLSAVRASETEERNTELTGAKEEPEELLRQEGFTYTIIRPGLLVSKPGKGKVKAEIASVTQTVKGEVSIEDAAQALVQALENKTTYNKTIELTTGDTPIEKALHSL